MVGKVHGCDHHSGLAPYWWLWDETEGGFIARGDCISEAIAYGNVA